MTTTGSLLTRPLIKTTLDPFVSSCEMQAAIHSDPDVAKRRAWLRETYGEVAFCFCADRRLDGSLCTEDLVPGWVKTYRSIGANFWAGEEPMQRRIESHVLLADRHGRPCTTYFDFCHTDCAGHNGDMVRAEETIVRFSTEKNVDYVSHRNPDGTRRLVSIPCRIDVETGEWTLYNGFECLSAGSLLGLDTYGIQGAVSDFFGSRTDLPNASIAVSAFLMEENVKYRRSHEGRGPLAEQELRPGVILAVGKGFPWVSRYDNVYVVEDHHRGYIDDLAVPLGKAGGHISAIVTSQSFSETLQEPFRRANAIRRSLRIADLVHGFLAAQFPTLYDRIPVIPSVFDWDAWMIKFSPETARTYGYQSWAH